MSQLWSSLKTLTLTCVLFDPTSYGGFAVIYIFPLPRELEPSRFLKGARGKNEENDVSSMRLYRVRPCSH